MAVASKLQERARWSSASLPTAHISSFPRSNRFGVIAPSATFSPDGKRIAYANTQGVFVMDADGLHQHKLVDLGTLATWLAWSPNGEHLRFTISAPKDKGRQSLWEISKDGSGLRELILNPNNAASVCCGTWTSDGRYYVFSSDAGGQWNIWAVREGRSWRRNPWHEVQLSFGPNSAISPATADGSYVFYYSGVLRQELQRFDLQSRKFAPFSVAGDALQLTYSRDGRWIAYVDGQTRSLFRFRTDGSDRIELASSGVAPTFPRWSPDGNWIAFDGGTDGDSDAVYVVASAGGPLQRLFGDDKPVGDVDWSSDSRRLILWQAVANNNAGSRKLVIVDFASKRATKIPGSDHLAMSRWSPDGRYISATSDDQTQLKLYDLASRKWRLIARGDALGISVWSTDGRYLYFQDLLGSGEQLRRYDMAMAKIETVIDFSQFLKSGVSRCALFGITPDGSPVIAFDRSSYDLFSAELALP